MRGFVVFAREESMIKETNDGRATSLHNLYVLRARRVTPMFLARALAQISKLGLPPMRLALVRRDLQKTHKTAAF